MGGPVVWRHYAPVDQPAPTEKIVLAAPRDRSALLFAGACEFTAVGVLTIATGEL